MEKQMICIICPRGCTLNASGEKDNLKVSGNACQKGEAYAINEILNPVRTVTGIVRVANREEMASVKTENPIPKEKIFELMQVINQTSVNAPVKIGEVIIEDIFGTNIIATKNIL